MTKTDWAYVSNDLVYGALFIYTIAFILYTYETAFAVRANKEGASSAIDRTKTAKSSRIATIVFFLATAVLLLGVVSRGVSANRVPWSNMYEYSISGALTFALAYLIVGRKYDLRWLGLPISIAVLLILGTAITLLYRPSAPLVPALQSTWLVVHVFAAILSGGVFLLSNTVAATYLWLDRMERKGERTRQHLCARRVIQQVLVRGRARPIARDPAVEHRPREADHKVVRHRRRLDL